MVHLRELNIGCVGGGTGLPSLLGGLKINPWLKLNAVVGASAMVACGALTMEEAWAAIHADTILLLFGMMIVVANLRLAGFFRLVALWVMRRTHSPRAA